MGMDVYGKNPTSEVGKYFRNNIWWWRPLWNYCDEFTTIANKVKNAQSNDGDGLNSVDSRKLAFELTQLVKSGHTREYAEQYETNRKNIPKIPCEWCNGTGIRTDNVAKNLNMKGCNGCDSTGLTAQYESMYPFSEENVKEFIAFLEECGGFEIC